MMEQQQVNVQELQRLNDAITMTMEAIRRVVPQLGVWSQFQNPFSQFGGQLGGQFGGQQLDPITQAYVHGQAHALRQILSQIGGTGGGMGIGTGAGIGYPGAQQFGAPWQQQQYSTPWQQQQQPYMPWQHQAFGGSPFLNLQQRPF
jgi:hypothetical protein